MGLAAIGGCSLRGPLRVGFIGGLSGRVADLGIGGRNGAQLAVDDLNAAGGIAGREVELLAVDDEQNDEVARRRFGDLLDAGARFVVGPMTSSVAVALAPLAAQRSVALISPTATTPELSGLDDAFFRVVPDAPSGARAQADLLLRRGVRRLATVGDTRNRAFSGNWTAAAARRLRDGGGEVVLELVFEAAPGLRFVELAQQVASAGADAALIAASAADSAVLVQQIRRLQPNLLIALSSWAGTEQLPQLGGRSLDGVMVAQYFDRAASTPRFVDFDRRYTRRFGEAPGYPSVNAYDATGLGAAALRQAGSGPVLEAVRRMRQVDGLQRTLQLDGSGDCQAPIFHAEIREGRYAALPA